MPQAIQLVIVKTPQGYKITTFTAENVIGTVYAKEEDVVCRIIALKLSTLAPVDA